MGKIPQGILGGVKGRVGSVVGADWKGINYIRTMPLSVANPNTAGQQAQRGAFTQVVLAARLLLANLIATYWDPFARYMSGYNHFISVNIDAFATAGFTTPANFFAARGILTGVSGLAITPDDSDNMVAINYDDNSGDGDALTTDELVVVYYNATQDYWVFNKPAGETRGSSPADIPDNVMALNDVLECYVFFIRPDVSKISDSDHLQATVIA